MKKNLLSLAAGILMTLGASAQSYPPAISLFKIGGSGAIKGSDSIELRLNVALACQGGNVIAPTATTVNMHGGVGLTSTGSWTNVIAFDQMGANGQSTNLTPLGNGVFSIRLRPRAYFGVAPTDSIYRLTVVFNAGGWANGEGKDTTSGTACKDFFIELGQASSPASASNLAADINFGVYPNPVNDLAHINYTLKETKNVTLKIYNILGKEVKTLVNSKVTPGSYVELWDGTNEAGARVAQGTYFAQIIVDNQAATQRIVLTK